MQYRNVTYKYNEWITSGNNKASGYQCEDKALLKGINTVSFGATTKAEMHAKIDHYIDNRQENIEQQKQYDKAEAAYYEKYGTVGEF